MDQTVAVTQLRAACLLQLLLCLAPLRVHAQTTPSSFRFGVRTGLDIDAAGRDLSRSLIGIELTYQVSPRWGIAPSVDYYVNLPGAVRFNVDARYRPPVPWEASYIGGGFTLPNDDGRHNYPGANAFLGLSAKVKRAWTPFVEARWVFFANYTSFTILTGAHVGV